jgi:hypothetical protein
MNVEYCWHHSVQQSPGEDEANDATRPCTFVIHLRWPPGVTTQARAPDTAVAKGTDPSHDGSGRWALAANRIRRGPSPSVQRTRYR